MTPELARIVEYLRSWHADGNDLNWPDDYAIRLGEGEAYVGMLLEQLDREGATDGPTS